MELLVVVLLLVFALPVPICLWGRRFLPRWLALGVKLLAIAYGGLLSLAGVGLLALWLASGPGDCLQRVFSDSTQAASPDGRYRAVISSGVCVTGLGAMNSYDGVDVEVETVATGHRVAVLNAQGGVGAAPRVDWLDGRRLKVTVHRPLPVLASQRTVGDVTIEFQVPRAVLASPDPKPSWFGHFTEWAGEHAVYE